MKKIILALLVGLGLAAPSKAQYCPGCIQNSATPQSAQFNVSNATIRGTLNVGTLVAAALNLGDVTVNTVTGDGSHLTILNAAQLSSGTVPSARVSGAYSGITGLGTIASGVWDGTTIEASHGGTGSNLGTSASGALPYFSVTGVMSALAPGSATYLLQSNGSSAPSYTHAPAVLGTNVTSIPLANLIPGALPSNLTVPDANLSVVSAAKVSGDIPGNAANINGILPLSHLENATLPTTIAASSITGTGLADAFYGGPGQAMLIHFGTDGRAYSISQTTYSAGGSTDTVAADHVLPGALLSTVIASSLNVTGVLPGSYGTYSQVPTFTARADGRLSAAGSVAIAIAPTQVNTGAFNSGVTLPAASVNAGSLGSGVIASSIAASGVPTGSCGDSTHVCQATFGVDGRATNAVPVGIPGLSPNTALNNVDNDWSHAQTSVSSWTINANLKAQAITATSITGDGSGLANLNPNQMSAGTFNANVIAQTYTGGAVPNTTTFASSLTANSSLYVRGAGAIGTSPAPIGTPPAIFAFGGGLAVVDNNSSDNLLLAISTSPTATYSLTYSTKGVLSVMGVDPTGVVASFGSATETVGSNGVIIRANSPDASFLAFSTKAVSGINGADYGAAIDYEQDSGDYRLLMRASGSTTFPGSKTLGVNVTAGKAEVRNMPLAVDGDITTKGDVNTRFTQYEPSINQILTSTNVGVTGLGSFFSVQDSTDPSVQKGFDLIGYDPDSGGMLWTGQQNHGTNIPPAWNFFLLDQASGLFLPNAIHIDTMTFHYKPSPSAPPVWYSDNAGDTFQKSTATAAEFVLQTGDAFTAAPNPNVGSSDAALIVGAVKGVGVSTITYSGVAMAGGVDINGYVSNAALGAGGGLYDPSRGPYKGLAAVNGGFVMGAYNRATNGQQGRVNAIGDVILNGGITDGGGASVNIVAGIAGGYNQNGHLAPGGNAHINFDTGDNLGGDSISNPAISTRTTNGGETLTFSINGEATQTITLGANANALAIANDIQAKVRLLTAANPDNQYAYTGFNAQVRFPDNALALVAPGDAVGAFNSTVAGPSSLAITGGTFATLAGLGVANGGIETSGSIGTYDFSLGQGLVPGAVDGMSIDLDGTHVNNGALFLPGGTNVVYKCLTAGAARAGTLTTVSADCGTFNDTGMRVP